MKDTIFIRDLHLRTIIGLNDWEREKPQDLYLNFALTVDLSAAGQSDDISDTVNYRSLCKKVIALVEASTYFLLEKLAQQVVEMIFKEFPVDKVELTIDKPAALRFSRSVAIKIERCREDLG